MPLHDVGYRAWNSRRCGPSATVWVIAVTGIRLAWESRWLRRLVFFAWSPAFLFAASFFAFEQAVDEGRLTALGEGAQVGRNLDGVGMLGTVLADALGGDPDEVDVESTRRLVWTRLLLAFMRSQIACTSGRTCVETKIVFPCFRASVVSRPSIARRSIGSRPLVGSSRITIAGS